MKVYAFEICKYSESLRVASEAFEVIKETPKLFIIKNGSSLTDYRKQLKKEEENKIFMSHTRRYGFTSDLDYLNKLIIDGFNNLENYTKEKLDYYQGRYKMIQNKKEKILSIDYAGEFRNA